MIIADDYIGLCADPVSVVFRGSLIIRFTRHTPSALQYTTSLLNSEPISDPESQSEQCSHIIGAVLISPDDALEFRSVDLFLFLEDCEHVCSILQIEILQEKMVLAAFPEVMDHDPAGIGRIQNRVQCAGYAKAAVH